MTRKLLSLGLSALALGGTAVGGIALAGDRAPADARQVSRALAQRSPAAVGLAESAVAAQPTRADLRALLGRSYLQAGRFQSARDAFADAVKLDANDGRSALNLALAQIATGDWGSARATLVTYRGTIPASDLGLATALAGDPASGVGILMQAAREPGADAKVRQNLGLTLALAGQWQLARTVAATDLSPADVDRRMQEWAAFAQPTSASDQVASLLGVRPQVDAGQPVALALAAPAPAVPMAEPAPVVAVAAPVPVTPVAIPVPAPVATPAAVTAPMLATVTFGPRLEVVQPLPVPLLRADGPTKVAFAAARRQIDAGAAKSPASRTPASGEWFVQLGAFENAGVARDAWGRISRRYAGLISGQPQGAAFRAGRDDFYRLSVGGYDRAGADGICRRVRAGGGVCFVRRGAGDRVAQWARGGVQLASR